MQHCQKPSDFDMFAYVHLEVKENFLINNEYILYQHLVLCSLLTELCNQCFLFDLLLHTVFLITITAMKYLNKAPHILT